MSSNVRMTTGLRMFLGVNSVEYFKVSLYVSLGGLKDWFFLLLVRRDHLFMEVKELGCKLSR